MGMDGDIVVDKKDGARISEREWHFPVGSSIVYQGNFGEPGTAFGFETGCEGFKDKNNQIVISKFSFENLDGSSPIIDCDGKSTVINSGELVEECSSLAFRLIGETHFKINYIGSGDRRNTLRYGIIKFARHKL